MKNILVVDSSPLTEGSVSRELTKAAEEAIGSSLPGATITKRDVGMNPPPHLDGMTIGAFFTPPEQSNAQLQQAAALSNELVDELLAADLVIIGSPMHNFGVTSGLKAYIDHLVRARRTFAYSETGPKGMVENGKVLILTARGSSYGADTPRAALDHQAPYFRTILGFIGITDVSFIHCEGTAVSDEMRAESLASAKQQIGNYISGLAG